MVKSFLQRRVFALFPLQFVEHGLNLVVVPFQLAKDEVLVFALVKLCLDFGKVRLDLGQFILVCFTAFGFLNEECGLVPKFLDLLVKLIEHGAEVVLRHLIRVHHRVGAVLTDGAAEADTLGTVLAVASDLLSAVFWATG